MIPEAPTREKKQPRPSKPAVASRARHWHIPNLSGWILAALAVWVWLNVMIPGSGHLQERGMQTKALFQAKQVALALRLFAADHDGNYPRQGTPAEMRTVPANSNEAFACLFPTYCTSERIFYTPSAAGGRTLLPDEVYDDYTGQPNRTLAPGENVYGYVMGLSLNDDPGLPLVVDGTDGTGHYVTDPSKRGGIWKGKKAIVIRADGSGELPTLAGPDDARFIPVIPGVPTSNLLGTEYLKAHYARLLDPTVAPQR